VLHKVDATFLAVRGPMTRACILENNPGLNVPEIYGDPALLLPFIYIPEKIEKKYKIGIIPHYADKKFMEDHQSGIDRFEGNNIVIDIQGGWKDVIEKVLQCEIIMSSSLHGIIVAEAYGIPAIWAQWTKNIIGGQWKFQDYFLGTGRGKQTTFTVIEPMKNLKEIQQALINSLSCKK
jgi:pyruvyltransferase